MNVYVLLDSGLLGLLCSSPIFRDVASCKVWLALLQTSGTFVVVPDVTHYEDRRELIRVGATAAILAGVAATIGSPGDQVIIATTNV